MLHILPIADDEAIRACGRTGDCEAQCGACCDFHIVTVPSVPGIPNSEPYTKESGERCPQAIIDATTGHMRCLLHDNGKPEVCKRWKGNDLRGVQTRYEFLAGKIAHELCMPNPDDTEHLARCIVENRIPPESYENVHRHMATAISIDADVGTAVLFSMFKLWLTGTCGEFPWKFFERIETTMLLQMLIKNGVPLRETFRQYGISPETNPLYQEFLDRYMPIDTER